MDHIHRIYEEEDIKILDEHISVDEVEGVLKSFPHDKCPGPDGWTSEFFLFFFDIMGAEIAEMEELFRTTGHIPSNLNLTFIALIPKNDDPSSFGEYRPIALYNLMYKISSKIIANRLKQALSVHISPEQYSFLKGRSIHDAIAIAQEILHYAF